VIIRLFGKAWIIINFLLTIYKTRLYSIALLFVGCCSSAA
jgi:hypothetical protein